MMIPMRGDVLAGMKVAKLRVASPPLRSDKGEAADYRDARAIGKPEYFAGL
jgi:hypothetical protein